MKYKAVLFDMDGTVLDTLEDIKNSVNRTMQHFSYPVCTLEQVRRYVGNAARRLIEQAVPEGTAPEQIDRVLAWYKADYDKNCNITTGPYEGICELLYLLRQQGVRLAVVSNKPDGAVKELAANFFSGLIEVAIGESGSVRRKPWPDTVDMAVKELGVEKADCVYVGDSEVDVLTAKNAQMDCISVSWGFRTVEELVNAGAECIVHNTRQLLEKL